MNETKALVQSKAFWSALLALATIVASTFHLTQFAAWAADPQTLDGIVQGAGILGALGAIVFRYSATAKTTTILPPPASGSRGVTTNAHWLACAFAVCLAAFGLGGCSTSQIASLQAGTTALVNWNNALITLSTTIIGDLQAQAKAFAPIACGGVNLGNFLLSQSAFAKAVDAALKSKQAQTTANEIQITATSLCQNAGLSPTVTALPPPAVPAPAANGA